MIRTTLTFLAFVATLSSCAQKDRNLLRIPVAEKRPASANEAVATFAQGCFWHTEIIFQSLAGVRDAVSGYAGGHTANPTYASVSTGKSGHAESVQVYYDPSVVSFETLVDAFFASHDPTTVDRQGNDEGPQYRSVAFYRNETEKRIILDAINRINASKKYGSKVVTQVAPFSKFYPAENYHQEYISNNPDNSYVQHVSIPDYEKFRKTFRGKFK